MQRYEGCLLDVFIMRLFNRTLSIHISPYLILNFVASFQTESFEVFVHRQGTSGQTAMTSRKRKLSLNINPQFSTQTPQNLIRSPDDPTSSSKRMSLDSNSQFESRRRTRYIIFRMAALLPILLQSPFLSISQSCLNHSTKKLFLNPYSSCFCNLFLFILQQQLAYYAFQHNWPSHISKNKSYLYTATQLTMSTLLYSEGYLNI